MLFRDSFITINGTEILARATAQNKLIWTKCKTTDLNSDSMSSAEMNALTDATIGSATSTGSVTNSIVNDAGNTTTLYCELNNNEAHGYARTFAVWGKIDGDTEEVIIVVARCGSGVTPVYINDASEGSVKAFVNFSLEITAEQVSAVQVQETDYYASNSALQSEENERIALSERVVTTHSATSTTTGEDQTIYGTKRFRNSAYFNISHHNSVYTDELCTEDADYIMLYNDILPEVDNDLILGSTGYRFNDIYTVYIHAETVNTNACATTDLFTNTIDTKVGNNIATKANIIPYSGDEYNLGHEDFMFKEGWFGDVYTNQLTAYTRITCDSYLPLNTSGSSLGSSTSKFDTAYIKNIDVTTLSPMGTDTIMMNGDVDIARDIYIEGGITVDGGITSGGPLSANFITNTILPNINRKTTATVMNQVEVGAIILLYVRSTYASQQEIPPGYVLDGSNQYLSFGFANTTLAAGQTLVFSLYNSTTESVGKFKTLSACTIPANGSGVVLAMRTQ